MADKTKFNDFPSVNIKHSSLKPFHITILFFCCWSCSAAPAFAVEKKSSICTRNHLWVLRSICSSSWMMKGYSRENMMMDYDIFNWKQNQNVTISVCVCVSLFRARRMIFCAKENYSKNFDGIGCMHRFKSNMYLYFACVNNKPFFTVPGNVWHEMLHHIIHNCDESIVLYTS